MKKLICLQFLLVFFLSSGFAFDFPWQKNNATEFINVETHFIFTDANGNNKKEMVYGSEEYDKGDFFVPRFKVETTLCLNVQMHATLLSKAGGTFSGVQNSEKNKTREITVEISFTKAKNIKVSQIGGITNVCQPDDRIEGVKSYSFIIKNDEDMLPAVQFIVTPAEAGEAIITVTYYGENPTQKIVDKSCDVFQTVYFEK